MCGRFALFASGEELRERYPFVEDAQIEPRYNIAPTQPVAAVRSTAAGWELALLRWGLIPSWASDPAIGNKLLNGRAETVSEKPSFRSAFKQRRCLIPASCFYEWQKAGTGRKQPYAIRPRAGGLFSFAGLWERWRNPQGETIETCTILTTGANDVMRPFTRGCRSYSIDPPMRCGSMLAPMPLPFMPCWCLTPVNGWKHSRSIRGSATRCMRGRAAWSRRAFRNQQSRAALPAGFVLILKSPVSHRSPGRMFPVSA
jgi:putative SOS response-associated peptidase YedK